ncbi:DNA/RNA helicase domain-containing protein [Paenibacillus agaridevorans]|uniref:DNA/RNA helicase domain-containing protein n=1 Tax=Paenibacillus agaridevorans TaxID=171404 RepID=UPI001FE47C71|nr:DNA/RNA helicase domain-containing protein [Paenibacillus agaridevorans]
MKPINLLSLVQSKKALSPSIFEQYMNAFSIQIKDHEVEGISQIVDELTEHPKRLLMLDAFYVGFTIPQISKEFDLIRMGKESIINIELKKLNTGDRMKKQLLENQYYLGFLGKSIHSFTYVSGENKLFYLNKEEDTYSEVAFDQLLRCLEEQEIAPIDNIYSFFDPTNYLVSPFNSTDKFMDGQYFLTDHQKEIKNKILKMEPTSNTNYFSIEGAAGTGKTLLTYTIAKEFKSQGKSVLIIHVGNLNAGQLKLNRKYKWKIMPVKNYEKQDFTKFDVIVFDEVQRISRRQLDAIIDSIAAGSTVIFSYDGEQCLSDWEMKNNIPQVIQSLTPHYGYKLTNRIRTNKEIASFIANLFDLKSRNPNQEYRNISVQYFSNAEAAMN